MKRKLPKGRVISEWVQGYLLASPFIIGFFVFTAYPMAYSIWLSTQKWNLLGEPKFVGFENIIKVVQNETARLSLYNSAFYTFLAVPVDIIIKENYKSYMELDYR